MKQFKKIFYSISAIICLFNFIYADPTDGCELDSNQFFLTQDNEVIYNSEFDIGGFQFNVEGADVNGASGGDAVAAGFTVSAGGNTVLGFSFTGSTISAGCGTLTVLDLNGDATGLSGIIVSDSSGNSLDFSYYESDDEVPDHIVEVGGGTNQFSPQNLSIEVGETVQWINLGGFHNVDGSINTYPNNPDSFYSGAASSDSWTYSFTFQVEGSYEYQCNPHAGMGMIGSVQVGDGPDDCPSGIYDCTGVCDGDAVEDECGECEGNGIDDGECDCAGNVLDCLGVCGGNAEEDCAGVCDGT